MPEYAAGPRRVARSEQAWLWTAALALFVVGDLATTGIGLTVPGVREAGPLTRPALRAAGPVAALALKFTSLVAACLLWWLTPWPYRLGVPLGLVALGGWVVGWNLSIVLLVG